MSEPDPLMKPGAANPRFRFGSLVAVCVVLAGATGLWLELRQLLAQQASLARRGDDAEQQLSMLKKAHKQLEQEHQQLVVDRDNLLAQVKRIDYERDQAQAERQLIEQTFQQVAAERLTLLSRVPELEAQRDELQHNQAALAKERGRLERDLAKAKGRSQEQALRKELAQLRNKQTELRRTLGTTKRQLQLTTRGESRATSHLIQLTKRLDALQRKYTEEVTQNASLRRKVDRLPTDVTGMARERERLLKDLADTHYNMGVMFTRKRDFIRAAKEFRQVIELRPDDSEAYYNLGLIYAEHLPDRDKAMKFFQKYLTLNPRGREAGWAKHYIASWKAWEGAERLE